MAALVDVLRNATLASPDKPAVILTDRVFSFADVDRLSSNAAAHLLDAGIRPGDRVALHLTNGIDIVVAYYACFKSGAIALPINTRFKASEIDYVLRHAEAAAYIGQPELARAIGEWPPTVRLRYLAGAAMDGARSFDDLLTPHALGNASPPADDSPAVVLYTSGTTARPKGVTHTQRTLLQMADATVRALFVANDVVFIPLPLVHMAALLSLNAAFVAGLTTVLLAQFDPDQFLDLFERERVTTMIGMPVLYRVLVEAQRQRPRRIASGREFWVGGDSVPTTLQEQFTATFGRPLCEAYGLSEVVPVSYNRPDDIRSGSLGRRADEVFLRVVDDEFHDVDRGQVGEIVVQSAGTAIGYWNDPSATRAAFREGWFLTGDLGREDADGVLWFAGRKKEIIVRGGSNISPQEVEEAVYQHPAVREVAVVGAPDDRWGECVVAAVVVREGQRVTDTELIAFTRERLADYKTPERVVFLPELPKGPTGKVLRRAVKESILAPT